MRAYVERLPSRVKAPVRAVRWTGRRATSRARSLPTAVIIGAQKSGTTSLYSYLAAHPAVVTPSKKEVHYFDLNWDRGVEWYRAHFPTVAHLERLRRGAGTPALTFEASPYYLAHPLAPQRLRATLPEARLVAVLREPAERASSHYRHERRAGREPLDFAEATERERERIGDDHERLRSGALVQSAAHQHRGYLARGRYAEQLEAWFAVFDSEQLLVLDSRALFDRPAETMERTFEFLGLPPHAAGSYPPVGAAPDAQAPADVDLDRLRSYFAPHNERLWALLERTSAGTRAGRRRSAELRVAPGRERSQRPGRERRVPGAGGPQRRQRARLDEARVHQRRAQLALGEQRGRPGGDGRAEALLRPFGDVGRQDTAQRRGGRAPSARSPAPCAPAGGRTPTRTSRDRAAARGLRPIRASPACRAAPGSPRRGAS